MKEQEGELRATRGEELHRKPKELTNLDSWRLSETEAPTKQHTRAGPRPPRSYIADTLLGLHVGPE